MAVIQITAQMGVTQGLVVSSLFAPTVKHQTEQVNLMIQACSEAYGEKLDGFHYLGAYYRKTGLRGHLHRRVLHSSLHSRMDQLLAQWEKTANDKQMIGQSIYHLLRPCVTAQHVRDTLPDCLTRYLPDWANNLERRATEAWSLVGDRVATAQYQKIKPKMEYYSALALIY